MLTLQDYLWPKGFKLPHFLWCTQGCLYSINHPTKGPIILVICSKYLSVQMYSGWNRSLAWSLLANWWQAWFHVRGLQTVRVTRVRERAGVWCWTFLNTEVMRIPLVKVEEVINWGKKRGITIGGCQMYKHFSQVALWKGLVYPKAL